MLHSMTRARGIAWQGFTFELCSSPYLQTQLTNSDSRINLGSRLNSHYRQLIRHVT